MGNNFQSQVKRWDVIAGLMATNGYKHLVDVDPFDGRVMSIVKEHVEGLRVTVVDEPVDSELFEENTSTIPRAENDAEIEFVFIEGRDTEHVHQRIQEWYPRIKEGGILAVGNFKHQEGIPVMRAVADLFPLYAVNVMPDNVAVIVKGAA
jgi:hypothetical protein